MIAIQGGVAAGKLQLPYQRATAGQPVRLAPRPPLLAGREELLAELHARFVSADDARPQVVALSGLGGAGKTSVAVEYAHRHLAEVAIAWQVRAEDPAALRAEFGELAAQLGARDLADVRDPVVSVHAVLAHFPAKWLLIFDNATDMASVAAFLPPAGPGRVLVTSQNPHWPGHSLEIPILDRDVAAGFLVNRTGDVDRRSAVELADQLGGLPLALEQAAAYMKATAKTLASYRDLFRQRPPDMLGRGEPTGYSKTVATTWTLAFERLQQAKPGAVGLLRLLAFCAPEAIPLTVLLHPRPGLDGQLEPEIDTILKPLLDDPLAADDAIAALRRYSLITMAADETASIHRLVQAVTLAQMPAERAEMWRQTTAAVIEAALPLDTENPASWPVSAKLLPHAQTIFPASNSGMLRIVSYLGYSGNYPAARDLAETVLRRCAEESGPEHLDTLVARSRLAFWTGRAGDAAAARDQCAALLPVHERVLGPEHPETLITRGNLGRWTGRAGDAAAARDQYAALLPVHERVLGPEHPETLSMRNNLGRWTGQAGDAAAARDQFAALLPVRERVLGPEHPDALVTRANLAYWTGQAGDAAAARDQYAALVPVDERVLGPEHPNTLITRSNLARWTGQAGDAAAARDQYAALLPVRERVLGPEHPETLTTRSNLDYWTTEYGATLH